MADVILTGLADEGPVSKRAEEQLTLVRALGLSYYSLRFVDVGSGVKNAMQLSDAEVARLQKLHEEFEVRVSSLASPIGKVKLLDIEDGTPNRYVPFERYLSEEVARAIDLARRLGTRLIRGFSFYPPRDEDPWPHVPLAAERLRRIAEACAEADLQLGLEVEANLVGRNGELEAALWEAVAHPNLGLVFDGGNLVCQGYDAAETLDQLRLMEPGLLWMHVKDYLDPSEAGSRGPAPGGPPFGPKTSAEPSATGRWSDGRRSERRVKGHVAEDALEHFVPADRGGADHRRLFAALKPVLPLRAAALRQRGIPGFFLDLEPHLKGGGQFGGFSGPDGFGAALRALCRVLDDVGLTYDLVEF